MFTWKTQTREKPPMKIFIALAMAQAGPSETSLLTSRPLYNGASTSLIYASLHAFTDIQNHMPQNHVPKTMCCHLNHLLIPKTRLILTYIAIETICPDCNLGACDLNIFN